MRILRLVQPGSDLRQSVCKGALLHDGYGGQRGVAAHCLRVPVEGVPQQLGHHIHSSHQQVELAVKATAVRYAQSILQTALPVTCYVNTCSSGLLA